MLKGIYTPKYHQDRLYYNIFKNHWAEFVAVYEQRFQKEYGFLEEYQVKTVEKFIKCGDPKHGFAYVECPKCHESYFVPFSCKTRVCNSCGEKHTLVWAEWVSSEVMLNANHRHITITIPTVLRHYFYKNDFLLKKYLETACKMINYIYTRDCPDKTAKLGIVAVLHTAGSRLNWNPHIHLLLTEGLLSGKTDDFAEPITYPLPHVNFRNINYLWRNKVLSLLKNFKKITHKEFLEYRKMYPKGFYVDVRYKATYDNPQEREKLAQYLIRKPIGDNRITRYEPNAEKVKIFYKGEFNRETGRNIMRSESMDPLEFIARRIQHILSPYFQKVRFMGIYSNKYRGQHKNKLKELKLDSKGIPRKEWDTSWRRLIWKIYDEDPLVCQNCGSEMKIKKVYTDYNAEKESKNLIHLRYYIRGRWRIERRKKYQGPVTGVERRKVA